MPEQNRVPDWEELENDSRYKELDHEKRKAVGTSYFDKNIASQDIYKKQTPERQDEYRSHWMTRVKPPETNVLGAVGDVAKGLTRVPVDALAAGASIIDDPYTTTGALDPFIKWNKEKQDAFANRPGAEEIAVPGTTVTRREMRQGTSSLGHSAVAMGAALVPRVAAAGVSALAGSGAAPLAGTVIGGMLGWTAGAAASGKAAYEMDKGSFVRQYRDFLEKKENRKISDEEFAQYKSGEVADLLHEHGLHEAGWESLGNMIELGILGKIKGGNIGKKALKGLTSLIAFELGSETQTAIGQKNVEVDLGMAPESERRKYTSVEDQLKSAREVAPATFLMGGITTAGKVGFEKAFGEAKELDDAGDQGPLTRVGKVTAAEALGEASAALGTEEGAARDLATEIEGGMASLGRLLAIREQFAQNPELARTVDALTDEEFNVEESINKGIETYKETSQEERTSIDGVLDLLADIDTKKEGGKEAVIAGIERVMEDPNISKFGKRRVANSGILEVVGLNPEEFSDATGIEPAAAAQAMGEKKTPASATDTEGLMQDITDTAQDVQADADVRARKKKQAADEISPTSKPDKPLGNILKEIRDDDTFGPADVPAIQQRIAESATQQDIENIRTDLDTAMSTPGDRAGTYGKLINQALDLKEKSFETTTKTDTKGKDLRETEVTGEASESTVQGRKVIKDKSPVLDGQEFDSDLSDAQKEAGNYKKVPANFDGLEMTIETPANETRSGTDDGGREWSQKMKNHYGYIKGTEGFDKDHVDMFLEKDYDGGAEKVHVVNQYRSDGTFDEHKVVIGAGSRRAALSTYKANYEKGWAGGKLSGTIEMSMADFKTWVKSDAPKKGPIGMDAEVDFKTTVESIVKDKKVASAVNSVIDARAKSLGMTTRDYIKSRGIQLIADSKAGTDKLRQGNKGAVDLSKEGQAIIHAFKNADASTILHELGHIFRQDLRGKDLAAVETWAGVKPGEEWSRAAEEKFARGWENYLTTGKAPVKGLQKAFDSIKKALLDIYGAITGTDIDVKVSPEVRAVFDQLLNDENIYGLSDREIGILHEMVQEVNEGVPSGVPSGVTYIDESQVREDMTDGSYKAYPSTYPEWFKARTIKKWMGDNKDYTLLRKDRFPILVGKIVNGKKLTGNQVLTLDYLKDVISTGKWEWDRAETLMLEGDTTIDKDGILHDTESGKLLFQNTVYKKLKKNQKTVVDETKGDIYFQSEPGNEKSNASISHGEKLLNAIISQLEGAKIPVVTVKMGTARVKKTLEALRENMTLMSDARVSIIQKQKFAADFVKALPPAPRAKLLHPLAAISRPKTQKAQMRRLEFFLERSNSVLGDYLRQELVKSIADSVKPKNIKAGAIKTGKGAEFENNVKYINTVLTGMRSEAKAGAEYVRLEVEQTKWENELINASSDTERATYQHELDTVEAKFGFLDMFGEINKKSVEQLGIANQALKTFLKEGRLEWLEIQKQWADIIGIDVNMTSEGIAKDGDATIETQSEKIARENKERGSKKTKAREGYNAILNTIQSFELALDRIAGNKKFGMLKSKIVKTFGSVVHEATNAYKKSQMDTDDLLMVKAAKIFGKKDNALNKEFDKLGIIETDKVHIYSDGKATPIEMSPMQAAYWYQIWMGRIGNKAIVDTFEDMGVTSRTMQEIENLMTPQLKSWAEYLVKEFYQDFHTGVNDIYKQVKGIDLEKTPLYTPLRREVGGLKQDKQIEGMLATSNKSTNKGGFHTRVYNKKPFRTASINEVLFSHTADMNHFKAWAVPTKRLNGTFDNPAVRNLIERHHGKEAMKAISFFQKQFTMTLEETLSDNIKALDRLRSNVTVAMVGMNPVVFVKQLTSIPALAADIPSLYWSKIAAITSTPGGYLRALKTLNTSTMMRDRYKSGHERDVKYVKQRSAEERLSGAKSGLRNLSDKAMKLTSWGDQAAIVVGGYPVYKYYYAKARKAGKSKSEAHKIGIQKFEMAVSRSQQSADMKDMGTWQSGDSMKKLFTMFMTSPASYSRLIDAGVRNLKTDKVTAGKMLFIYGVVMPMVFQAVSDGFLAHDEDDDERLKALGMNQMSAVARAPFNGVPIARTLAESAFSKMTGTGWRGIQYSPITEAPKELLSIVENLEKGLTGGSDRIGSDEYYRRSFFNVLHTLGYYFGMPTKPASRVIGGILDATDTDLPWREATETERKFRRGIGFSRTALGEK